MAYTQADLDALDTLILGNGAVKRVTFADRSVEFNTLEEMLQLRAFIARQLAGSNGTRYASTSKGTGRGFSFCGWNINRWF